MDGLLLHVIFISQITDDNIDLLSKMVHSRILHHKFPNFFFAINKYLCGKKERKGGRMEGGKGGGEGRRRKKEALREGRS